MNTCPGFDVLPSGSWDCGAGAAAGGLGERSRCGGRGDCGGGCGQGSCGGRCGDGGACTGDGHGGAGSFAADPPRPACHVQWQDHDGTLLAPTPGPRADRAAAWSCGEPESFLASRDLVAWGRVRSDGPATRRPCEHQHADSHALLQIHGGGMVMLRFHWARGPSGRELRVAPAGDTRSRDGARGLLAYVHRDVWNHVATLAAGSEGVRMVSSPASPASRGTRLAEGESGWPRAWDGGQDAAAECRASVLAIPWWVWWLLDKALFYGTYCGPMSPDPDSGPDHVDGLDLCCREHDKCYKDFKLEFWNALPGCGTPESSECDAKLVKCAKAFDCNDLPMPGALHCITYRTEIISYFG